MGEQARNGELRRAAQTVLDGLNARIEQAPDGAVPVFDGIADLHDALQASPAAPHDEQLAALADDLDRYGQRRTPEDIAKLIRDRDDLRNSLQDAYDEMRGHGWYIETAMAEALAKYSTSNIDRNVIADMTIYLPGPHAVNADCAGKRRAKRPFR
jgi:hypothetical protein